MATLMTFLLILILDFFTGVVFYGVGKVLLYPFRKNPNAKEGAQQRSLNVLLGLIVVVTVLYGLSSL